jgi:hypothetical protein
VISSNTPLKNDVNCCNLVEARGEPRTNGEDLSTTASKTFSIIIDTAIKTEVLNSKTFSLLQEEER